MRDGLTVSIVGMSFTFLFLALVVVLVVLLGRIARRVARHAARSGDDLAEVAAVIAIARGRRRQGKTMTKKIHLMITAFRDGFQSVYGARVLSRDYLPAVEAARSAGILHFEAGGGAMFQSPFFYCKRERLRRDGRVPGGRGAGRQPADPGPRHQRRRPRVAAQRHDQAARPAVQEARHHDDPQLRRAERRARTWSTPAGASTRPACKHEVASP